MCHIRENECLELSSNRLCFSLSLFPSLNGFQKRNTWANNNKSQNIKIDRNLHSCTQLYRFTLDVYCTSIAHRLLYIMWVIYFEFVGFNGIKENHGQTSTSKRKAEKKKEQTSIHSAKLCVGNRLLCASIDATDRKRWEFRFAMDFSFTINDKRYLL